MAETKTPIPPQPETKRAPGADEWPEEPTEIQRNHVLPQHIGRPHKHKPDDRFIELGRALAKKADEYGPLLDTAAGAATWPYAFGRMIFSPEQTPTEQGLNNVAAGHPDSWMLRNSAKPAGWALDRGLPAWFFGRSAVSGAKDLAGAGRGALPRLAGMYGRGAAAAAPWLYFLQDITPALDATWHDPTVKSFQDAVGSLGANYVQSGVDDISKLLDHVGDRHTSGFSKALQTLSYSLPRAIPGLAAMAIDPQRDTWFSRASWDQLGNLMKIAPGNGAGLVFAPEELQQLYEAGQTIDREKFQPRQQGVASGIGKRMLMAPLLDRIQDQESQLRALGIHPAEVEQRIFSDIGAHPDELRKYLGRIAPPMPQVRLLDRGPADTLPASPSSWLPGIRPITGVTPQHAGQKLVGSVLSKYPGAVAALLGSNLAGAYAGQPAAKTPTPQEARQLVGALLSKHPGVVASILGANLLGNVHSGARTPTTGTQEHGAPAAATQWPPAASYLLGTGGLLSALHAMSKPARKRSWMDWMTPAALSALAGASLLQRSK